MTSGTRLAREPHSRARERHLVHVWTVELQLRQVAAGQLAQLRPAADHRVVPVLAPPDRQGRTPVALAGERPVDVVLQPLSETAVLEMFRVPAHLFVGGQYLALCGPWSARTMPSLRSR